MNKNKRINMILTQRVDVKIATKIYQHYKDKGYEFRNGDVISVKVCDLTSGSNVKIHVRCDECGREKMMVYKSFIKSGYSKNYYLCQKCKMVQTNLEKYGVDNVSKSDIIKQKKIDTSIEKYGVEYYSMTDKFKKQMQKNTSFYNEDTQKKIKESILKKYGVDNVSKNKHIKEKIKQTNIKTKRKQMIKNISNLVDVIDGIYHIKCNDCNEIFEINRILFYKRRETKTTICTNCNPVSRNVSGLEKQLLNFIKENYGGTIFENSKNIIPPYELDIYIPEYKLAFEFNGLYWHSELYKPNNYHRIKTDLCEENGIQLIHIWEDDWNYKQDILKSMVLNKMGKSKIRIFARNCIVEEITDNVLVKGFLDNNHIQGFVGSSTKLGLFYENELVSLMAFNKNSRLDGIELNRFCNKINTNVIGSASKLLKYYINNYNFDKIISYSDRCYSDGNLYEILGFDLVHTTRESYSYIVDGVRVHKSNYRKENLLKEGYDIENKTEHEIMLDRDIFRVYNSGNNRYELKKDDI